MNPAAAERRQNVRLMFASLAGCLLVLEILARAVPRPLPLYVPSANPRLIYEHNPLRPEINELGMRQAEVDPQQLARDFVIAAIGDSHTFSFSSERSEDTFPARLEDRLRALTGARVSVLNFGVSGYNMSQELEVLRQRALPLAPDYVILQYCINDEHVPNFIQPEHPGLNRLLHASALFSRGWMTLLYSKQGLAYGHAFVARHAPDLLLATPGLVGTARGDPDPRHAPHPPRARDRVPARYHDMIGRANLERDVRLFGAALKRAGVAGLATGFIEPQHRDLYDAAGFRVFSFDEVFAGRDMRDYGYDPADTSTHFSAAGSDLIGRALARFVAADPAFTRAARQKTAHR